MFFLDVPFATKTPRIVTVALLEVLANKIHFLSVKWFKYRVIQSKTVSVFCCGLCTMFEKAVGITPKQRCVHIKSTSVRVSALTLPPKNEKASRVFAVIIVFTNIISSVLKNASCIYQDSTNAYMFLSGNHIHATKHRSGLCFAPRFADRLFSKQCLEVRH